MLPDQVSHPGPLTYESGALLIALQGPANSCQNVNLLSGINAIPSMHRRDMGALPWPDVAFMSKGCCVPVQMNNEGWLLAILRPSQQYL